MRLWLKSSGNGTIASPDIYICPECGGDVIPDYDETSGGTIVGTGTGTCEGRCGKEWSLHQQDAEEMPHGAAGDGELRPL